MQSFSGRLDNFHTRLWSYHIKVPDPIARHFWDQDQKRVVCRLNGEVEIQCAIMSAGEKGFFILINQKVRTKLKLKEGSPVEVELTPDKSEYGLPMPEELSEMLHQDPEGNDWFKKLTPGKQRNLIYLVGQVKSSELRIQRALIVVEHLKSQQGKIDFKALYSEIHPGRK